MSNTMFLATLILLVGVGFSIVTIICLGEIIKRKLKKEVFSYIKIYNEYLLQGEVHDSKKRERYQEQTLTYQNEEQMKEEFLAIPLIPKQEQMQYDSLLEDYRRIRRAFFFDRNTIANALSRIPRKTQTLRPIIQQILDKLSFHTIYLISILQSEQQKEFLFSILIEEEQEILMEYLVLSDSMFDVIEFIFYLENKAKEVDDVSYICIPMEMTEQITLDDKMIHIMVDPNICQGFQIYQVNYLYNYALDSSDLAK